jgi:hypothetical protein
MRPTVAAPAGYLNDDVVTSAARGNDLRSAVFVASCGWRLHGISELARLFSV